MQSSVDIAEFPPCVIQDGVRVDAAELAERAGALAAALAAAGKRRVALTSDRVSTLIAALMACRMADCDIVLARGALPDDAALISEWKVSAVLDEDLSPRPIGGAAAASDGFRILICTSGTTGVPKLAAHRLEGLLGRIRRPQSNRSGRWLLTYHPASFAGMQVVLTALVSRHEIVAVADSSIPKLVAAAVAHRPTLISATPTFWRSFLIGLGDQAAGLDVSQITLGGEAADQPTMDRLRATFPNAGITHIYATTEAGALFAVKDGKAGFPAEWLDVPIEGVGLRIANGLLEVKSGRQMEHYVGQPASRSPFTGDGWLATGDCVERRGDRVVFVGRADATINVGGAKVSPEELESALLGVPGVADLRIYGTSNPITGMIVSADIVLLPGADPDDVRLAISRYARSAFESYKVPRVIHFVDRIEYSETGKKRRVG